MTRIKRVIKPGEGWKFTRTRKNQKKKAGPCWGPVEMQAGAITRSQRTVLVIHNLAQIQIVESFVRLDSIKFQSDFMLIALRIMP